MRESKVLLTSCLALALLNGGANLVQAQVKQVAATSLNNGNVMFSGQVLDETGEPIVGAAVRIEGVMSGTVTDLNGNFSIILKSAE